jgi:hypothetical protein
VAATAAPTSGRAVALVGSETPDAPGTPRASSTPRPTATATPRHGVLLQLTAANDAWIRVMADDKEVFAGFLRSGASQRWEAQSSVRVRTGNAGGTTISINGQELAPLGGAGTVAEREWRLQADGNVVESP